MGFEIGLKNEPCWFLNGHIIRSASISCEVRALLRIASEDSALLVHEAALQVIESRSTTLVVQHYQVRLTLKWDGNRLSPTAMSYTRKRE
jgi:hypothetical protein